MQASSCTVAVTTVVALAAVALGYAYCRWRLSYWRRRGAAQLARAHWLFGHYRDGVTMRAPPGWHLRELYRAAPHEPFVGFYIFHKPCLLLRDPEIIKQILVTDFDSFADRNFAGAAQKDSFGMINLFGLRGPAWRLARRRLAPVLAAPRMRELVPAMLATARPLLAHAAAAARRGRPLDAQDLSHRFAADLIARVALGTDTDSFAKPDAYTAKALEFFSGFKRMVALVVVFFVPWLPQLAALVRAPLYFEFSVVRAMFRRALAAREAEAAAGARAHKGDFFDTLLQLKNGPQDPAFEFSGERLLYQAGMYFSGFESGAVAVTFLLRELARRPALAARARAGVRRAVQQHGWTHAALCDMPLLARCLREALRRHPPLATLDRRALRDYQIPGTNVYIEKGTAIYVSVSGLHSDPQHFPEPERFDPERFAAGRAGAAPDAYLPFGCGPRMCASVRGGELHVMVVLATILYHFELSEAAPDAAPDAAPRLDPRSTFTAADGGVPILFRELDTSCDPNNMTISNGFV